MSSDANRATHTRASSDYYDLGDFSRAVTTRSEAAQTWFNRGLIWNYGFNHTESARCFEHAIAVDPDCAMAYWGLAWTLGPNYNKPWDLYDKKDLHETLRRTYRTVRQAKTKAANATPVERALINALQSRYPQDSPTEDPSVWNRNYADAMQKVYSDFKDDLDVAALYADSLMELTPWNLWDLHTGKPTRKSRAPEAKMVLDRALAQEGSRRHPGLLHFYIHLTEMSREPELALTPADQLRGLVPDAGHLQHMPAHIDVLCGEYRRAIASSLDAIRADIKFVQNEGGADFYTFYTTHNIHTLVYAAMHSGQYQVAMKGTAQMEAEIPDRLLRIESPPMADWMESGLATRPHVLIRFGRWQDVLDLPFPKDPQLYCMTTATLHYAKGIAHAALGQVDKAENHRAEFLRAKQRVPSSRMSYPNKCSDLLAVAEAMLEGEIEYRRGNIDVAFAHLQKSMELDDALVYSEPSGWMQPTRHAYAALLVEQGRLEDAVEFYAADLGFNQQLPRARQHPNNVWALHGFHECLVRLGRTAEARMIEQPLQMALAVADVPIEASCLCRLTRSKI